MSVPVWPWYLNRLLRLVYKGLPPRLLIETRGCVMAAAIILSGYTVRRNSSLSGPLNTFQSLFMFIGDPDKGYA